MTEHRTTAKLVRFRPGEVLGRPPTPPPSAEAVEIKSLMTAGQVGHVLQVSRKRVYEVVGHLAIQIAPHTLRWRPADIVALIDERRRAK